MGNRIARRDFLKLAGLGSVGVVLASALPGVVQAHDDDDFFFLQLSDTHWGFEGAPNPDARGTLPKAIRSINSLEQRPDFIMFTGDLTHTTDSPVERRKRLSEFKSMVSELNVKTVRFMPCEHDASLDNGKAFQEFFGPTHYTFDHKGIHFIVLDNVSDPRAQIGDVVEHDEMNALVVERVVRRAEELLECLAVVERRVVLTRHEADGLDVELAHHALELRQTLAALDRAVGRMGEVAGKHDEV